MTLRLLDPWKSENVVSDVLISVCGYRSRELAYCSQSPDLTYPLDFLLLFHVLTLLRFKNMYDRPHSILVYRVHSWVVRCNVVKEYASLQTLNLYFVLLKENPTLVAGIDISKRTFYKGRRVKHFDEFVVVDIA